MSEKIPDPLILLREWTQKKKAPELKANKIIFGNVWYSKDLKTRFKSLNGGYYTLESVIHGFNNSNEQYGNYLTKCIENKIPIISAIDLKPLVKYISGEIDSAEKIDTEYKLDLENHSGILTEKRPNNEKQSKQPNKKQKQEGEKLEIPKATAEELQLIEKDAKSIKKIISKEKPIETRRSVLLTKTRNFTTLIDMVRLNGKIEAEEKAKKEKEETENTAATGWSEGLEASKLGIITDGSFSKNPKKSLPLKSTKKIKSTQIPIIIVPGGATALLNIYNAVDFFSSGIFKDPIEILTKITTKLPKNKFYRKSAGNKTVPFELYDNVKSFTRQDWDRVIAVFSNAKDWQFKGWKEWKEDPTEIFSRVCGFYLKFEEEALPEKIKNWNVTILKISKLSRHLDQTAALEFWTVIDSSGAKKKPNLALN